MGGLAEEIDRIMHECNYSSSGPGRCCKCRSRLRDRDVKIVLSSKTLGSSNLPLNLRLLCSDCFLEKSDSRKTAIKRSAQKNRLQKGVMTKMLG